MGSLASPKNLHSFLPSLLSCHQGLPWVLPPAEETLEDSSCPPCPACLLNHSTENSLLNEEEPAGQSDANFGIPEWNMEGAGNADRVAGHAVGGGMDMPLLGGGTEDMMLGEAVGVHSQT